VNEIKHPTINLPLYKHITAISLNEIIDIIIGKTQKDIFQYYNVIDIDLTKSYCKRFFYHNFIKQICDIYIKQKEIFTLVFYYNEDKDHFTSKEIEKVIKLINKHLPICIYTGKVKFKNIKESSTSGEIIEECEKIKVFIDKKTNKDYSFRNITSISKKYELNFLSERYFSDLNIKYGLIR